MIIWVIYGNSKFYGVHFCPDLIHLLQEFCFCLEDFFEIFGKILIYFSLCYWKIKSKPNLLILRLFIANFSIIFWSLAGFPNGFKISQWFTLWLDLPCEARPFVPPFLLKKSLVDSRPGQKIVHLTLLCKAWIHVWFALQ